MAKTNPELAFEFACLVPEGFRLLGWADVEAWALDAMDVYDKRGLDPAIAALRDVSAFAAQARDKARTVAFEEIARVLELFVQGLAGRPFELEASDEVYTDTVTLFLPRRVALLSTRAANFMLYKAIAANLWAQIGYGTFRADLPRALRAFSDPDRALRLFHALETLRLDAHLARELPGLQRELASLLAQTGIPPDPERWADYRRRLSAPAATVHDTLALLPVAYHDDPPAVLPYQGVLHPDRTEAAIGQRKARGQAQLQNLIGRLFPHAVRPDRLRADAAAIDGRLRLEQEYDPDRPGRAGLALRVDGERVALPPDLRALLGSIAQDLGRVPDDYPTPAGGENPTGTHPREEDRSDPQCDGETFLYDEWDYRRAHYRKDWCSLRERDVVPQDAAFVRDTLRRYAGLVARLRKTFEALRGENRFARRQPHGEDIDLDAYVAALADLRHGRELSERLFLRTHRAARNVAVMFMVDMSGSTKGWINEAEREALVLLCEALEVLGDRYAIYGFSGVTRGRCELYRVKRFDEPYSDTVKGRIAGIAPQDYTRMGVAVRHLTRLLCATEARTKLLITLSDGRPDDYDGYRGDHGIEDTRQALFEARRAGIHPFCITIDETARDYLPHLYGAARYALVDDVRTLPLKVADIYRRLTA